MNKSFSFIKFYFTIVAIISVIGMAVAFGIAMYQQGMQLLISDAEYLQGHNHREIQQCENSEYMPRMKPMPIEGPDELVEGKERTPTEIQQCKQEATERIHNERSFDTKEATIGGLTR